MTTDLLSLDCHNRCEGIEYELCELWSVSSIQGVHRKWATLDRNVDVSIQWCGFGTGCIQDIQWISEQLAKMTNGRMTKWRDVTISLTSCHYIIPIVHYCHLLWFQCHLPFTFWTAILKSAVPHVSGIFPKPAGNLWISCIIPDRVQGTISCTVSLICTGTHHMCCTFLVVQYTWKFLSISFNGTVHTLHAILTMFKTQYLNELKW